MPNLEHMTDVKQVIPSVKGDITVELKRTDNLFGMEIISPEGTTAIVGIPKASITPDSWSFIAVKLTRSTRDAGSLMEGT